MESLPISIPMAMNAPPFHNVVHLTTDVLLLLLFDQVAGREPVHVEFAELPGPFAFILVDLEFHDI